MNTLAQCLKVHHAFWGSTHGVVTAYAIGLGPVSGITSLEKTFVCRFRHAELAQDDPGHVSAEMGWA